MTTFGLGTLVLSLEFALVSWVILFVLLRRRRLESHADQAHAGAVMEHLENSEMSRRDALSSLFETTYRLEGDELAAKVDEYVAREKAFYNAMLSLYLSRDRARLSQIPEELAKVLMPWAKMTPSGMVSASDVSGLESDKAMLAAELDSTKNTLEQLMDEYMAAFKRDQRERAPAEPAATPPPAVTPAPETEAEAGADAQPEPEAEAEPTPPEDDFDVQTEADAFPASAEASIAQATRPSAPEMPTAPSPVEDPIDQATLDAMLNAFGEGPLAEDESGLIASQEPARNPEPEPDTNISDEERKARDELDGLADLFDDLGDSK
jgi:hypothetical protein